MEGGELQVSVSFGRFEKDSSLSWERWSSFSPNKYLEEVEKCATPGSVAKKAAYFEAHYRRIAARKAELLLADQEKQQQHLLPSPEWVGGGASGSGSGSSPQIPSSVRVFGEGDGLVGEEEWEEEEQEQNEDDDMITLENERLSFEVVKEEFGVTRHVDCLGRSDETDERSLVKDRVKEQVPTAPGRETVDSAGGRGDVALKVEAPDAKAINGDIKIDDALRAKMTLNIREDNAKLELWRKPQKVPSTNPVNKEKTMVKAKKKPAPTFIRSPRVSAPRTSKPSSVSPAPSATKSVKSPGIDSSLKRNKSGSATDVKKVSPKTLHRPATASSLSPSLDSTTIVAPRRSLIMERMGDKDIVKRAFKTFQNHVGLSKSFGGERSSVAKSAPSVSDSSSIDIRKESSGPKAAIATKASHDLRSQERAEKRNEVQRKPERKSIIKEAEKTRLRSKPKEQKEKDTKRLTQGIRNFKATPMPAFYGAMSNQRKMGSQKGING